MPTTVNVLRGCEGQHVDRAADPVPTELGQAGVDRDLAGVPTARGPDRSRTMPVSPCHALPSRGGPCTLMTLPSGPTGRAPSADTSPTAFATPGDPGHLVDQRPPAPAG